MNKITDIKKIIIVLVLVFLDQISKYFFYGKNIEIIKDIFIIKSSTNTGVIFGIFSGNFFPGIFFEANAMQKKYFKSIFPGYCRHAFRM